MGQRDPRVDAYIARSSDFAKPILRRLRRVVHTASPAIEEILKWGSPSFVHKGIVCSMAAFKEHCVFGLLNERGIKSPTRSKPRDGRRVRVPGYFMAALRKNRKALATFEGFTYTNKKDYVDWVTGAKGAETRRRRIETSVDWMAEGRVHNWRYLRK